MLLACSGNDVARDAGPGASSPVGAPPPSASIGASDAPDASVRPDFDAGPDLPFDAKLYTLPQTSFEVARVEDAIEAALAASPSADNLIFFVHGRSCGDGGEPQKSLGSVVPELASAYQAGAIMFYWPGSDNGCPLGFPENEARAAGPALRYLLMKVHAYGLARPAKLANVKLTLLAHSMGNIVLESALSSPTGLPSSLFSTLVLNASTTALANHATWLASADFVTNVYVTVNANDKVLLAAGLGRGPRLGRQLESEPLTSRADYVDVSATGVNHKYYVPSGQKGTSLPLFFQEVLNGRPYDFSNAAIVDEALERDGAKIYVLRP